MRLFYVINGWAGRSDGLDALLRFFYVGTVPLLATALAALLFLAPRRHNIGRENTETPVASGLAARRRIAYATLLSLALCVLAMLGVQLFQKQVFGSVPISPRPFMTHWVNALIVEPNDNSFPCFEVLLAAATAMLLWAAKPAAGLLGWVMVFVLGFARTFCGMNYLGDSIAGAVVGASLSTFSLAAWHVPLQLPALPSSSHRLTWRLPHQAAISLLWLGGFSIVTLYWLATSPAHHARFKNLWGTSAASAAPHSAASPSPARVAQRPRQDAAPQKIVTAAVPLPADIHESEGGVLAAPHGTAPATMAAPGEMLLASRAARLDGHLPAAETHLMRALDGLSLPHRLIGVNVAQVRAGSSAYRCAAIRFAVSGRGAGERRRVAETAATLVKHAFQTDGELQHVDVLGLNLNADPQHEYSPRGGARPVFTASVTRADLFLENRPAWVNWSGLDSGIWLRARSLLYVDSSILPAAPKKSPTAAPKPAPQVKPQGRPQEKPTPKAPLFSAPEAGPPSTLPPSVQKLLPPHLADEKFVEGTANATTTLPSDAGPVVEKRTRPRLRRYRKSRRYRRYR